MKSNKLFSQDDVIVDLQGEKKDEIISELVDHMIRTGKVKADDRENVLNALFDREKKMSTGMQNGVAIPHAKTDAVDKLVAVVGLKKSGVDFSALDGEPSRIFIMTLSPLTRTGPHIQFLAEISRILSKQEVMESMLKAESSAEVVECIQGA